MGTRPYLSQTCTREDTAKSRVFPIDPNARFWLPPIILMKFSQAAEVLTNSTPVELISWEPEGERRRRHEERVSSRSFSPRLELQVMPEKEASWTWTWRLSPIREYQMWLCDGDTEIGEGLQVPPSHLPSLSINSRYIKGL